MRRTIPAIALLVATSAGVRPGAGPALARLAEPIAPGAVIARTAAAGEVQVFSLAVSGGTAIAVTIDQAGADVALTWTPPAGPPIAVDTPPRGAVGPERLLAAPAAGGTAEIAVRTTRTDGPRGRFTLRAVVLGSDAAVLAAARAWEAAAALRDDAAPDAVDAHMPGLAAAAGVLDRCGERELAAAARLRLGGLQWQRRRLADAAQTLGAAADAFEALDRPADVVETLQLRMRALRLSGRLEESHADSVRAWPWSDRVDARVRGLATGELGSAWRVLGDDDRALEFGLLAIDRLRTAGTADDRIAAWQAAIEPLMSLGRLDEALRMVDQALALAPQATKPGVDWSLQYTLGRVHGAAGDHERAIAAFRRAHELSPSGSVHRIPIAISVAQHLNALGEPAEARNTLEAALGQVPEPQRGLWAVVATELGATLTRLGEAARARDLQERALAFVDAGGSPAVNRLAILSNLADARRALGDLAGARAATARLADADAALPSHPAAADLAQQRARDARAAGDLAEAQRWAEQGVAHVEAIRDGVRGRALRTAFASHVADYYQDAIDIALARHAADPSAGHAAAAFLLFERSRARSLADLLGDARVDVRADVDPTLVARARALQRRLAMADARLRFPANAADARRAPLEAEIDAATRELAVVDAETRQASPRYRATSAPPIGSIAEVQALLDGDTVLLAFADGLEGGHAWAVTRTGVRAFTTAPRATVETAVRRVQAALRQPAADRSAAAARETQDASAALGRLVLGPIAEALAGEWRQRRLAVVTSGALEYVPFAALIAPVSADADAAPAAPRWLGADHEIALLPSASVLALLRDARTRRAPSRELAVIADPVYAATDPRVGPRRMPFGLSAQRHDTRDAGGAAGAPRELSRLVFSREEARALASLAGRTQTVEALDFRASPDMMRSAAVAGARVVHVATHGVLDANRPERSGLVLSLVDADGRSRDGMLRLNDIFGLSLSAELVVLSGCETGLGRHMRGEGLVGLTRAFMYAGAPRVVSSLWAVDDQATAQLMARFYRHMLKDGRRPAAALRAAQIEMAGDPRWSAPYFWAGFVLHGDWR